MPTLHMPWIVAGLFLQNWKDIFSTGVIENANRGPESNPSIITTRKSGHMVLTGYSVSPTHLQPAGIPTYRSISIGGAQTVNTTNSNGKKRALKSVRAILFRTCRQLRNIL